MKDKGYKCDFIDMTIPECSEKACVLIIRDFCKRVTQKRIYKEINSFSWDSKYFDTRRNKVLNKRARSNVILLDGQSQKPDYKNKKGTIIDSEKLKVFSNFKNKSIKKLQNILKKNKSSTIIAPLICEGNRYFDLEKCGIGFHGDCERRKVICLSLGCDNYKIR